MSAFICFNFDDYGLQFMKIKTQISENIRILHKTSQKIDW